MSVPDTPENNTPGPSADGGPDVFIGEPDHAPYACVSPVMCALDDRIMDHLAATARSSTAAMAAGPLADATCELIDERCRILS
jgi:hypothetical protein